MSETADVVIIGGGVMGCAIAYNLGLKGVKAIVIEKSDIGGEASGSNGGGVRQSARNLSEMPLAMASVKLYGQLHEELGMDVEYVRKGNLRLCLNEAELAELKNSVKAQKDFGLDLEMVDTKGVKEILPLASGDILGASWCPTDGHANPFLVTYAFMKRARELGAIFHTQEEVVEINLKKSRVVAVTTNKRRIETNQVLNAAGTAGRKIAKMVGLDLPMKFLFSEALITEETAPLFPQMIGSARGAYYGRQTTHGSVFWGGFIGIEDFVYSHDGTKPVYNCIAPSSARGLIDLLPVMKKLNVIRTWSGIIAAMSDGIPVLGRTDEVEGYISATGFSGHGFGLGPIIGRLLSQVVVGEEPTLNLDAFKYDRFERGGQSACDCDNHAACTIGTASCPQKRNWLEHI
jgi:sarcosine oxidase subunit beta